MKKIIVGLFFVWSTSSFAERVYECHAGQNTFMRGGLSAGTLMQVINAKVPADGKLYEFKADKLDKGFIYISVSENSDIATGVFVPASKRFTAYPDMKSLTPFFEFESIYAVNPTPNATALSASHEQLITIPGSRTKNGLPLDVSKSIYLNCFFPKTPAGDGIEF